jgi:hypothetical protein
METNETVMIAMTVGAHKIKLMAGKGAAIYPESKADAPEGTHEGECTP